MPSPSPSSNLPRTPERASLARVQAAPARRTSPTLAAKLALGRVVKRLGLPVEPLFYLMKAGRMALHPAEALRRRRTAAALRDGHWSEIISRAKGFGLFGPDVFPGTAAAMSAARSVFQRWEASGAARATDKPFLVNVLDREDLVRHPELLDFALSDAVLRAATAYFGEVPLLRAMAVFYSPKNDLHQASQKFHIDTDDLRQLKCFINVEPTDAAAGPFSFLDAELSDRVRAKLQHGWKGGRIEDEDVFSVAKLSDLRELLGPSGSGGLIDTSRCLHFGSRARGGSRLVLMFQFTSFAHLKEDDGYGPDGAVVTKLPADRYRGDALRMLVLGSRPQ
jgi:hypothetical protein